MSDKPTPRTDEFAFSPTLEPPRTQGEWLDFARTLERELASRVAELERGWQPMATAPKDDGALLLLMPEMEGWIAGAWRGGWSYALAQWVLHTAYRVDGKSVCTSEIPQPLGWRPLPSAPEKDKKWMADCEQAEQRAARLPDVVCVPREVAQYFANERLSGEPTFSDLLYRTPAMQLREQAERLEERDDKIRAMREAMLAAQRAGG